MAVPYVPTEVGKARINLMLSPSVAPNATVWLWKHFSTTGRRANQWEVYVPFATGRYAVYAFGDTLGNGVLNWMATREGVPALWVDSDTATKSGTWNASTNAETYSGTYRYSETATNTIQATVTGHTLFWRGAMASNGGYALVSIDGDATLANRLPVVTQALVDAGGFASGDLGKRYIETYSQNFLLDEHACIAEGLSDAAHTVLITVKGTKRTASAGNRVYVSAIGGATAGQALNVSNAGMGYVRNISQGTSTNDVSASGSVMEFTPDGFSNPKFLGNIHSLGGSESVETQTSAAWVDVNGATVTLANGSYTSSQAFTLKRVTQVFHPSTPTVAACEHVANFQFRGDVAGQCTYSWAYEWKQKGVMDSFYAAMLPLATRNYWDTNFTNPFDRINIGGDTTMLVTDDNDGTVYGQIATNFAAGYATGFDTLMTCYVPNPTVSLGNYADSSPDYTYMWDRTNGLDKTYFARVSNTAAKNVNVGDEFTGEAWYRVFRISGAAVAIEGALPGPPPEEQAGSLTDADKAYLEALVTAQTATVTGALDTISGAKLDEIHDSLFNTLTEPLTGIGTRELTLADGTKKTWDMQSDGVKRTRTPR